MLYYIVLYWWLCLVGLFVQNALYSIVHWWWSSSNHTRSGLERSSPKTSKRSNDADRLSPKVPSLEMGTFPINQSSPSRLSPLCVSCRVVCLLEDGLENSVDGLRCGIGQSILSLCSEKLEKRSYRPESMHVFIDANVGSEDHACSSSEERYCLRWSSEML